MASGLLSGIAKASDSSTRTTIQGETLCGIWSIGVPPVQTIALEQGLPGPKQTNSRSSCSAATLVSVLSRTELAEIKYRRGRE
jgi:hypothetical protein